MRVELNNPTHTYIYIPVSSVLGCPFRCSAACAAEAKARFKPELTMSMHACRKKFNTFHICVLPSMKLVFLNYRNPRHLEFNMPFESFRNFRNAKKYEKKDSAGSGRADKKEKKNKKDKKEKKRKAAEEEDDDDEDEEEEKPKPRARKTDGKAKAKVKSKGKK